MSRNDRESEQIAFVVTSGAYSDYSVSCVFLRREDAETWVDAGNSWSYRPNAGADDEYRIEEFPLLGRVATLETLRLNAGFDPDSGALLREVVETRPVVVGDPPEFEPCRHKVTVWEWARSINLEVQGTDEERVRKVFSEQAAMIKANPRAFTHRDVKS